MFKSTILRQNDFLTFKFDFGFTTIVESTMTALDSSTMKIALHADIQIKLYLNSRAFCFFDNSLAFRFFSNFND